MWSHKGVYRVELVKGGGKIYQCGGAKVSHLAAVFCPWVAAVTLTLPL